MLIQPLRSYTYHMYDVPTTYLYLLHLLVPTLSFIAYNGYNPAVIIFYLFTQYYHLFKYIVIGSPCKRIQTIPVFVLVYETWVHVGILDFLWCTTRQHASILLDLYLFFLFEHFFKVVLYKGQKTFLKISL
jgi:hypothetical protein